jgi:hypothetical protein
MEPDVIDKDRPARVLAGLREFYHAAPASMAASDRGADAATSMDARDEAVSIMDRGAEAALALFHDVAATVPAYQSFLREKGVDPSGVRTIGDFERVPLLAKETYQRRYTLPELCRGGRLDACDMVAVSSGSSGTPTVWPRSVLDEMLVAARFEQVFRDSFRAGERRTLAVICFALGSWVGGMYTAACCRHLAAKGYAITVATPGNDKQIERLRPRWAGGSARRCAGVRGDRLACRLTLVLDCSRRRHGEATSEAGHCVPARRVRIPFSRVRTTVAATLCRDILPASTSSMPA